MKAAKKATQNYQPKTLLPLCNIRSFKSHMIIGKLVLLTISSYVRSASSYAFVHQSVGAIMLFVYDMKLWDRYSVKRNIPHILQIEISTPPWPGFQIQRTSEPEDIGNRAGTSSIQQLFLSAKVYLNHFW